MFRFAHKLCLLAACAVVLVGCASGSSFVRPGYDFRKTGKIGVVVESRVLSNDQKNEVADLFSMEILKKGYSVIDRANLEQIMKETDFQAASVTSPDGKAKLELHNISSMVIVNISEFTDKISMTAKMVEVGTGSLIWMGEGTGSLKSGLGTIGGAVIGAAGGAVLGNALVKNSTTSKLVGAAGGAIAGGVIGKALEPEQADLVRSVIGKVTKDLPSSI